MKHSTISLPNEFIIGKDILELVTSGMYIDPLSVYREYVQNAVDSIEEAVDTGIMKRGERGRIDISIDIIGRTVRIRDNGTGVPNGVFGKRLTALGGSKKRGTKSRGFRGVGRLAGLGYCQTLVFRSRSKGDKFVQELHWDCKKFKSLVTDSANDFGIEELIRSVATIVQVDPTDFPEHFYEVELQKPIRIKNDLLLNKSEIIAYLAQTAPVPFDPGFKYSKDINKYLKKHCEIIDVDIYVDKDSKPIYRPYKNEFSLGEDKVDSFSDIEFRSIEDLHGNVAAVLWILHHGYHGAIPGAQGVKGLRARSGNIQVGDHRIFSDIFPEVRFASWTVGEVHILDPKIIPNGRRDDFENNAHYNHVLHQLGAVGDHIARICRNSSVVRNRIKAFDIGASKIDEKLTIIEQGALPKHALNSIVEDIRSELFEIKKTAESSVLTPENREILHQRHSELDERLSGAKAKLVASDPISSLPKGQQATIRKMINLIYECSNNRIVAKTLVDRILARLGESTEQ